MGKKGRIIEMDNCKKYKYIDCYVGIIANEVDVRKVIKWDSDWYSNPYFNKFFSCDLMAFCDCDTKHRFGRVWYDYTKEHFQRISKLYQCVTGNPLPEEVKINEENYPKKIKNLLEEEIPEPINSSLFLFALEDKDQKMIPPPGKDEKEYFVPAPIEVIAKLDLPDCFQSQEKTPTENFLKKWNDAVAIPTFASVKDAKELWFDEDRKNRSALVMITGNGDTLLGLAGVPSSDATQPLWISVSVLDDLITQDNCLPYWKYQQVLLKREAYDRICREMKELAEKSLAIEENSFLKTFQAECTACGLRYTWNDLKNFHTAVKSGYLTILSGMSGTGKSSIVKMYAKALGDNCKLTFISVRPFWTDDSDLLGYLDPEKQKYHCSTGLVDFLIEAAKPENRERLYLVCLDEMNLARVEHYFSQFLSVLEKLPGERSELVLYHRKNVDASGNPSEEAAGYPQTIEVPDNIRFVGTVNIDDTTYNFADKVRDRANIINLQVENYSEQSFLPQQTQVPQTADSSRKAEQFHFCSFVRKYESLLPGQEEKLRQFLWRLHACLNGQVSDLGVSPRTVRAIGTYLANYPSDATIQEREELDSEALDFQVKQRILTKLHGSVELLNPLLEGEGDSNLIIKTLGNKDDFPLCVKTIEDKQKELKIYGYCP